MRSLVCEVCGRAFPPELTEVIVEEEKKLILCQQCAQYLGTCALCLKAPECGLNDIHDIPIYIMKTERIGNMVTQKQELNPEAEKRACANCTCWCEEAGCMKEYRQGCRNYILEVNNGNFDSGNGQNETN